MEKMTTIKISKKNVDELHGCKGWLTYISDGKKTTLDDTITEMIKIFKENKRRKT